jgi:hypothetical protein
MAYVEIPMGGQKVRVDIVAPEFAMELTQQEVLKLNNLQVNALNAIAAKMTASIDLDRKNYDESKIGQARASDAIRENTRAVKSTSRAMEDFKNLSMGSITKGLEDESFTLSKIFAGFSQTIADAGNSLLGLVLPAGRLSNFIAGLGTAAGFIVGTLIGTLEKFGAGMQKLSRVGVGFGETLVSVRQAAGQASLNLDQFGKLIATNGRAIRSLGENTGEGALRFGQLSAALQRQTAQFGYFGLNIGDLNQLLAEEIDARRVTLGNERLRTINEQELAVAIQENVTNQMALARITGQDYQERLAAANAVRQNAIAQAYLRSRGDDDIIRRRLENLGSALNETALGALGPKITNAIINSLATGMNPAAFEPQLFAYLNTAGQEFYRQVTGLLDDTSISMEDYNFRVTELATDLARNADQAAGGAQNLINMAVFTQDDIALMLLTAKSVVEDLKLSSNEYERAQQNLTDGANRIAGLATDMERFSAQFSTLLTNLALATFAAVVPRVGGEILTQDPAETLQGGINALVDRLAQFNNEIAPDAIAAAANAGELWQTRVSEVVSNAITMLTTGSPIPVVVVGTPPPLSPQASTGSYLGVDGTDGSNN